MYEHYYGLKERPFDLSPNPRFLFLTKQHREALTHLRYGLSARPGLTVLVGEAGTGKTTLVRAALHESSSRRLSIVHLSNPTLTRSEFFEYLASGFGFSAEAAHSKTRFLQELEVAMASRGAADGALALIVDEAQSLPHELLEEVRLLSNTEAANGRTLAVALVGQPELAAGLNDPALRQLKQRVALRCELRPLTLEETAACIAERVRIAGGVGYLLFSREAVMAIHERSRGIPRTISVICDNALVSGFAADQKPVGPELIQEVCRDFGIGTEADSQAAGAAAAVQQAPGARVSQPIFGGLTRRWRFSFF
jgi:type II secretory pathway predicted ATPase ExeA